MTVKRVGVFPAAERVRRASLFDALEQALPVRFEGRALGAWRDLDGGVVLGSEAGGRLDGDPPVPCLRALCDESPGAGAPVHVRMTMDAPLPTMLAGRTVPESAGAGPVRMGERGMRVLAHSSDGPVWAVSSARGPAAYFAATAPLELGPEESLRGRLTGGRFLALLPLVSFLRELTSASAYAEPGLRACIVLDDPNLRAASYGYVDFAALARHAAERRYHVSVAMVPADGRLARQSVVNLFAEHPRSLSLGMHGNDHLHAELGRTSDARGARAMLAAALRRAEAFERSSGVRICRVMLPPHDECSENSARQMLDLGFEAMSSSTPRPWFTRAPMPWTSRPRDESALTCWWPADIVAGGLPVLLRLSLGDLRDDLPFRAFLGQPLIFAAHHADLAEGFEGLGALADEINGFGDVRWMPLTDIARSSVATRREGETLHVRLYTRRVVVDVPEGVREIAATASTRGGSIAVDGTICSESARFDTDNELHTASLPVSGRRRVAIEVIPADAVDPTTLRPARSTPGAFLRRRATEARDRIAPVLKPTAPNPSRQPVRG